VVEFSCCLTTVSLEERLPKIVSSANRWHTLDTVVGNG
jgi:hypothetical protein